MRIDAVYIASFGKFKDYTLCFTDGFNLIYGDNEDGKSTLMAFLKMMFYGTQGKSADLAKNPRKKYLPWDSDRMAGSVDFTHNGSSYRLEREFKGSNTSDKLTLINLDLGTKQTLSGKKDAGAEFFGLSLSAFEKSVFIGGLGAPEKDETADGEINSKLSNLVATGDEDISFEKISKRLLKAKETLMSRSGRIGTYDKGVKQLEALEDKIRAAKEKESVLCRTESAITTKEAELDAAVKQANRLFEILKNAERIKKRATLQKYLEACDQIEAVEKQLTLMDGGIADERYKTELESALDAWRQQERRTEEKALEITKIEEEIEALSRASQNDECRDLLSEKARSESQLKTLANDLLDDKIRLETLSKEVSALKPVKKSRMPLLIGSGAVLLIGLVLAVIALIDNRNPVIGSTAAAVGLLLTLLGLFVKKVLPADDSKLQEEIAQMRERVEANENKQQELMDRITQLSESINRSLIESGSRKSLLETRRRELLNQKEKLIEDKDRLNGAAAHTLALCAKFRTVANAEEARALADKLNEMLPLLKEAEIRKTLAADGTGCSSKEEAVSRLAAINADESIRDMSAEQLDSAKDELKRKTDESGKLRAELAALKSELKTLTAGEETLPLLEKKRTELSDTLRAQKSFCDAADLCLTALEEAFSELRQNFSSLLEEKTSGIFAGLTGEAYDSVSISKDFDVNVTKNGVFGRKEWQYLSAGTADQVYLSLRLALASLIEEEDETLPILLDDALTQYDDKRALRAISYLKEYANTHQILFFTCHSSYAKIANEFGIPTTTL